METTENCARPGFPAVAPSASQMRQFSSVMPSMRKTTSQVTAPPIAIPRSTLWSVDMMGTPLR